VFFPSLVQGLLAPKDLIRALILAYATPLDVLIIARGGGAEEDLSAFNDESLVRKVAESPIPTIAAIGHEINLSLVDLVADKRVSTPTGAAELAVRDKQEIYQDLNLAYDRLTLAVTSYVQGLKKSLQTFQARPVLVSPLAMYAVKQEQASQLRARLIQAMTMLYQQRTSTTLRLKASLAALSPYAVIQRGYALATTASGKVVHSIQDVAIGEVITTQLKDGTITSEVKKKGGS
jgi:exodeoxyribonuclease VII large subunit